MTDVIEMIDSVKGEIIDQQQVAERLLAQAKEKGVNLVGSGGLLGNLTKTVLETALGAEYATVQTCIIRLIRNTFKYASRKYWDQVARDLKPGLHGADRGRSPGKVRGVRGEAVHDVPGDSTAVEERVGRVHPRSWTTTSRSAASSARGTQSSPSTPGTAARFERAVTSPTMLQHFAITFEGRIN